MLRRILVSSAVAQVSSLAPSAACPVASTLRWIRDVVIELQFCPWAARAVVSPRFHLEFIEDEDILLATNRAMKSLVAETGESTTLLALNSISFDQFLNLVSAVDDQIDSNHLRGKIQLAHFHPDYRFAHAPDQDPGHYTNRSPFPLLHFLREDDITNALTSYEDTSLLPNKTTTKKMYEEPADAIWQRNLRTCRRLGSAALQARLERCYTSSIHHDEISEEQASSRSKRKTSDTSAHRSHDSGS